MDINKLYRWIWGRTGKNLLRGMDWQPLFKISPRTFLFLAMLVCLFNITVVNVSYFWPPSCWLVSLIKRQKYPCSISLLSSGYSLGQLINYIHYVTYLNTVIALLCWQLQSSQGPDCRMLLQNWKQSLLKKHHCLSLELWLQPIYCAGF